ncbi:hypothetical protein L7F22_022468 [Adiantum nelumboides]|nr:hypothetical protein [Adiantum nelumboides]
METAHDGFLVNKGLVAALKEHKEGVYKDDEWEELDARARATICLHLGESIFFTIMDKTTAFELWDSLCSAWDGKSAFNKVFLMKKLMHLSMKEGSSVSSHLNESNSLYSQLTSKGLNFDDEMKAIFLLCALSASWDTFNTAINNSTHGGKIAFSNVTSALLIEEIQRQSLDSGGHGNIACMDATSNNGPSEDVDCKASGSQAIDFDMGYSEGVRQADEPQQDINEIISTVAKQDNMFIADEYTTKAIIYTIVDEVNEIVEANNASTRY